MTGALALAASESEALHLVRYEAMCNAIADAYAIDEVKDIRDRALAWEAYSRQAKNFDAERHAAEIRVRAERRCGELLKNIPKATGGQPYQSTGNRDEPVEIAAPYEDEPESKAKTLAELGISKRQSSEWQQLADVPKEEFETALAEPERPSANKIINRTNFTGNTEWFTPDEYIDLARSVLGEIDLDPATHLLAQERIKAAQFFTESDDGLSSEWHGRIWLNPPYAQPAIENFIDKLIAEVDAGRVTEAIVLTHNYTDTAWFQKAARASKSICFTKGRIRFVAPDGTLAAPTQGQAFFYFGPNQDLFSIAFADVGFIAELRS